MHFKSIPSKTKKENIKTPLSLKTFKGFWTSVPEIGTKIKHISVDTGGTLEGLLTAYVALESSTSSCDSVLSSQGGVCVLLIHSKAGCCCCCC